MKIPKFEPIRIEDFENLPFPGQEELLPDGTLLLPIPEQSTLLQRLTKNACEQTDPSDDDPMVQDAQSVMKSPENDE